MKSTVTAYGEYFADKKLKIVNREIRQTYRTAQKELKEKLADFEKRHHAANAEKKRQLEAGEISQQEYRNWMTGQIFIRKKWQEQIRMITSTLLDANRQALNVVNNARLDVFAENYNYNAWRGEAATGVSFNIYSSESVARLIEGDPQLLPEWEIDQEKDYIWNQNKVNNIVRQGILQGEGIDQITARLCSGLATMNENKMRMFARTAMTGAQNAGRQKQMEDAASMGIEVHKAWRATHDQKTRDVHRDLDGQEVPFDKPFKSELGDIRFPADPQAEPANTYNCRCTMVTIYPKYEDRTKKWGDGEVIDGQTYEEWKKGKHRKQEVQLDPLEQAKKLVAEHSGAWKYNDLSQLGGLIAQSMEKDIKPELDELEALKEKRDSLHTEIGDLRRRINNLDAERKYDEADKLEAELHAKQDESLRLMREYNTRKQKLDDEQSARLLGKLSEIRTMGGIKEKNLSKYVDLNEFSEPATDKKLHDKALEALNYYPKSWLMKSSRLPQTLCPHWTTDRAYYSHISMRSYKLSEIRFNDRLSTNIHELGHRMERAVPAILRAEKEFYKIRTKGERLKWLGSGYDKDEKARFDKFMSAYMGKDYGGRAYELVSMGFQNIYTNYSEFMRRDSDMANWILGILAGI